MCNSLESRQGDSSYWVPDIIIPIVSTTDGQWTPNEPSVRVAGIERRFAALKWRRRKAIDISTNKPFVVQTVTNVSVTVCHNGSLLLTS